MLSELLLRALLTHCLPLTPSVHAFSVYGMPSWLTFHAIRHLVGGMILLTSTGAGGTEEGPARQECLSRGGDDLVENEEVCN